MSELTYSQLLAAVDGEGVAIRSRLALQPAAGKGTKVMPATYGVADSAPHRYAVEERLDPVTGTVSTTVLLDSVASQANRMEEALLEGWELGELDIPVAFVDFTGVAELADLGRVTSLEVPHRIADAIIRDALLDGTLFRLSAVGRSVTDATPKKAAALLAYCPHALLFGMWDSTGPKGGLGSKFQRAIVSEIIGFDAHIGTSVGSRLDPLDIRAGVAGILEAADPKEQWTFDPAQASREGGKEKKSTRPSEINHGNVTPSLNERSGGVTISRAEQTVVISLAALRRLRFPLDAEGQPIPADERRAAESAARTTVAAIGIAALAYQHEADFDLRSRCLLLPEHAPKVELVGRDGGEPASITVSRAGAQGLLREAAEQSARYGLGFGPREIPLEPAPKFVELLKRSRLIAVGERLGGGPDAS